MRSIIDKLENTTVWVVGDDGEDHYHVLSPTGRQETSTHKTPIYKNELIVREGLATNVVANLNAMGADAYGYSFTGTYEVKDRYIIDGKYVARGDRRAPIIPDTFTQLVKNLENWGTPSHIIVSDYGKGTITEQVYQDLLNLGIPLVVDPHTSRSLEFYKGCTVFSCNADEATHFVGNHWADIQAGLLYRQLEADVVIRRGSLGATVLTKKSDYCIINSVAADEVDSCGAGDTHVAAMTAALAAGASLEAAVRFGNLAAAIAVSKPYTHAVTKQELIDACGVRRI